MSFTFDFKEIIRKRAQICDRCSLRIFCHAGSVTRIAFKYKLTVFELTFSKMISLFIILCLFIHNSRSKHSRKASAQASLTENNCSQF